jgi:hypothetical protein
METRVIQLRTHQNQAERNGTAILKKSVYEETIAMLQLMAQQSRSMRSLG